VRSTPPTLFVSFFEKEKVKIRLKLTSQFNEVGFFLEISGNPEISELKNSIWVKLGKSLGDLA